MTRIKSALTAKGGEREANAAEWRRLVDEQAASVLATIRRDALEAEGRRVAEGRRGSVQGPDPGQIRSRGVPLFCDRPAPGRRHRDASGNAAVLSLAFSATLNARVEPTRFGIFRM